MVHTTVRTTELVPAADTKREIATERTTTEEADERPVATVLSLSLSLILEEGIALETVSTVMTVEDKGEVVVCVLQTLGEKTWRCETRGWVSIVRLRGSPLVGTRP